ncbi:hypothetical protein [Kutzneria buriramensis]|uniref:hypothetical protein n=1 Tax=Kutzneria buriramensis TaxID=1045776 RepID=UPI001476A949|nr:hypothetical protein [Kutzneria buriramensis]
MTLRSIRTAVLAVVVMCAAVLATQAPAHAGSVPLPGSPSYCKTHPTVTDCGGHGN